jgi:AcrR family transcriptional regulator
MDQIAKQERSRKRIEIILETAEKILLEDGIDQITIANISNRSGLKITSTYKFFQTPEAIKSMLISNYLNMCALDFEEKTSNINTSEPSVVVMRSVEILFNFYSEHESAQKLLLSSSAILPVEKEPFHNLSNKIQSFVEMNISLPDIFNKDGVFRVITQIILSIFALNTKESGSLNEVGKIEAHRAAHAYLLNWLNQSS